MLYDSFGVSIRMSNQEKRLKLSGDVVLSLLRKYYSGNEYIILLIILHVPIN